MAMCTASVVISISVLYLHHHVGYKEVPHIVRIVCFRVLARALFMKSSVPREKSKLMRMKSQISSSSKELQSQENMVVPEENKMLRETNVTKLRTMELSMLQNISMNLEFIRNCFVEKVKGNYKEDEWKALARVVDRLFFWICFLITFVTSAVMVTRREEVLKTDGQHP